MGVYLLSVFACYFAVGILIMLGAGMAIEHLSGFIESKTFAGIVLALNAAGYLFPEVVHVGL
jgi:hypothetical protein